MSYKCEFENDADDYCWQVKVKSAAHLDYWILDYYSGLIIKHQDDGTTIMKGELGDLPAVYGLVLQLRDSGVELLSLLVERRSLSATDDVK